MRNKIFYLLFLIIGQTICFSQFTILGNNKGGLLINSTNGGVVPNVIDIQLHMSGNVNYDYPNWSIIGKVTSPIRNSENKIFPVDKMKLRYRGHRTEQYFSEINPNVNQIGANQSLIPMDLSPKYFVQNSSLNATVPTGKYGRIVLEYDVIIEAGNYLEALKSWQNYKINYEFSLLDNSGRVIGSTIFPIEMQIHYDGNYQELPELAIQINNTAQNAKLVFETVNDYLNGVTKIYENGLNVTSNTSYEVTVKSLSDKLRSVNSQMDVSLVNVQLKNSRTNTLYNKESLSTIAKRVATGTSSSNSSNYSIIYSISPSQSITSSKIGFYTTQLIYTVSPL